jgi:DNA-binding GntR family transcriptional regulator
MANEINKNNKAQLEELAYNEIRKMILNGSVSPGDKLTETAIAEKFSMSRTPVRNAFIRLKHEKLLSSTTGGGTIVASISPLDVSETYDIREVIEGLAARLLARRITPSEAEILRKKAAKADMASATIDDDLDFHSAIVNMCGNARLVELVDTFCIHSMTFDEHSRQMVVGGNVNILNKDRDSDAHSIVAEKIIKGDGAGAEESLKYYIRHGKITLLMSLMGLE